MDEGLRDFAARHQRLRDKHRRLSHGYVTRVNRNGVIEHVPARDVKGSLLKPLAILVAAFFGFKILLLSQLGAAQYSHHLDILSTGNVAERVGAAVLAPDPLTQAIAALVPSAI